MPENADTSLDSAFEPPITYCKGKRKDGTPCTVARGLNEQQLCSTHAGRINHSAAAKQRAQLQRDRREAARETVLVAAERSKLGLRGALAVALSERQDEIVQQLMARAVDDGDTQLLLRLFTEALGKPGEAAVEPLPEPQPSLEEVVAAWRSARDAGEA